MVQNDLLIDTSQSFTKQGLKILFEKGLLEIGININYINHWLDKCDDSDIYMLNEASFNYVFPNGNKSPLNKILKEYTQLNVLSLRKYFIDNFFG
jgi:hypothetical protein